MFIAPNDKDSIVNEIFYQKDNFAIHITSNSSSYENAERWIIGTERGIKQFLNEKEEIISIEKKLQAYLKRNSGTTKRVLAFINWNE